MTSFPCEQKKHTKPNLRTCILWLVASIVVWRIVYTHLAQFASFMTFSLFQLKPGTNLASAVQFFLHDTPKILMLVILVVFFVGILRTFITPERTKKILAGKHEFIGNILASVIGIITPFCSCCAIPLFIGFVGAGIPLGVSFSFLIASPMINEVAVGLLYGLLGWKIAAIYSWKIGFQG